MLYLWQNYRRNTHINIFKYTGLCGYFCPCCLMCENAKRLDKSQCLHCLLFCLMPCIPTLITRGEVREQHQIEGSVAGDACAACCCTLCATVQVANELDHYGK